MRHPVPLLRIIDTGGATRPPRKETTVYQLNLKGFAPAYYYTYEEAIAKFLYVKKHFSNCSLRKIPYAKTLAIIWKEANR